MPNVKAQNSNKIQSSNDKVYDLEERTAKFGENIFELDLSFACLPSGRDFDI